MKITSQSEFFNFLSKSYGKNIRVVTTYNELVYQGILVDWEDDGYEQVREVMLQLVPPDTDNSDNSNYEYFIKVNYGGLYCYDLDSIYEISSIGTGGSSQPTETIDYTEQFNKTNQLQFFTIVLLSILIGCILGKIISKMLRGL